MLDVVTIAAQHTPPVCGLLTLLSIAKLSGGCRGHHMPVYTVRWNLLHTRTFLSCGADWALKVWDEAKPKKVSR